MANVDEIKEGLLELLNEGGGNRRKWFFPRNVDSSYKLIANLTLGEIVKYIIPALLIVVGICFIPPQTSILLWIVKSIFIVITILVPLFYVLYRPVKGRDNIRTKDFVKEYFTYQQRRKIYYKKPKRKPWDVTNNE